MIPQQVFTRLFMPVCIVVIAVKAKMFIGGSLLRGSRPFLGTTTMEVRYSLARNSCNILQNVASISTPQTTVIFSVEIDAAFCKILQH